MQRGTTSRSEAGSVRVWDLGVRVFHWGLVAAVVVSGLTGFILGITTLQWHLVAGVVVMGAVVWRVVWGLLGSAYARFAGFAYRPAMVLAYMRGLCRGDHQRYLGHNPLGAVMVFALLIVLPVIGLTGVITLGGMLKQGPLRAFIAYATGLQALELHNLLAILLLVMIGAHIAGVAFESWRGRENLVVAMVSGDKPSQPPAKLAPSGRSHPLAAVGIAVAILAVSAAAIAALAGLPGLGVPPTALEPVFAEQCGACHLAFPPSLAPASTWNGILADLQHHFGADASLAPDQVTAIRGWLDANAAGHWDTLPSHLLRAPALDGSLRITDTPGWRGQHAGIAAAVFAAGPVYRRSNCAACHGDAATGRFAPQAIAIPTPLRP
jgi:cytochrome b/mono/diheme cytochrome c family protein